MADKKASLTLRLKLRAIQPPENANGRARVLCVSLYGLLYFLHEIWYWPNNRRRFTPKIVFTDRKQTSPWDTRETEVCAGINVQRQKSIEQQIGNFLLIGGEKLR